jgi:hypothetical protein
VVKECLEVVEVEDIDAATLLAVGRKSMLASEVCVIALSIESLVDADTDTDADTRNAAVSAVEMLNI